MAAQPLKRSDIEAYMDWTRVGPDELALLEQLDGATNGDYEKIVRELTRRGALHVPEGTEHPSETDVSEEHAAGGGAMGTVRSLFGRFFAE